MDKPILHFNSLVLITTNICNLRCRHCYPSSGVSPDEVYRFGANKMMTPSQAETYIRQIPQLKNIRQRLHIGGGESTLFKEFKEIVSLGQQYGLGVSIVTNCSWAKDQDKADAFIEDLARRGVFLVEVSLSTFHQEFLSIEYAVRAIRACKKHGLQITLRPILTKTGSAHKTLEKISAKDLEGVSIALAKCIPVGRAREETPPEEFLYEEAISHGGCHGVLNLAIRQDGSVYPCCAGADITKSLCLGNANEESLKEIIRRAELDPLLIALTQFGTRYLAELLREGGGKDFLKEKHVNICHLCNDLFMNDETAAQVRRVFMENLQKQLSRNCANLSPASLP